MDGNHKIKLYAMCQQLVEQRIITAKEAMDAAQAAANNEGKSSAGDKYETGRAMMQLERDQHARLLAEAMKLKQALDNIDPHRRHDRIQPGSIIITDQGKYFLSVSMGKLNLEQQEWIALSPLTPLGAAMAAKKAGESFNFNKKEIKVLEVY